MSKQQSKDKNFGNMNVFTTEEIYKLASEISEKEYMNLYNLFTDAEINEHNCLVRLGDTKEVALWTVISQRYKEKSDEIYKLSYEK